MTLPTLAEFLAGAPLPFRSFSGREYTATWTAHPLGHITYHDRDGARLSAPIVGQAEAERFHAEVTAEQLEAV